METNDEPMIGFWSDSYKLRQPENSKMETKVFTKTVIFTTAERPEGIPADWFILNAHRPLHGTKTWQGECRSGIFYAAIEPNDRLLTDVWLYESLRLDGCPVEYLTAAEVENALREYCTAKGYDPDTLNGFDERKILAKFHNLIKAEVEYTFVDKHLTGIVRRAVV